MHNLNWHNPYSLHAFHLLDFILLHRPSLFQLFWRVVRSIKCLSIPSVSLISLLPSVPLSSQPLCTRLETFRLDPSLVGKQPNLVHFPPDFQPIPCKPLFFDLALNHVAFPPLDDKVEQKGKGGLTGYIKGIFGFGS